MKQERPKTMEDAVLAMNAIKLLTDRMEAYFQDEKLSHAVKNRKSQIIHHQIREIAEEWA